MNFVELLYVSLVRVRIGGEREIDNRDILKGYLFKSYF